MPDAQPKSSLASQSDLVIRLQRSTDDGKRWDALHTVYANRVPRVRRLIPWIVDLNGAADPKELRVLAEALRASDWITPANVGSSVLGLPGHLDRALNASMGDVRTSRAWAFVAHFKAEFGLMENRRSSNIIHYLETLLRRYDLLLRKWRSNPDAVRELRGGIAQTVSPDVSQIVHAEIAFHEDHRNLPMARLLTAQCVSMLGDRRAAAEVFAEVTESAEELIQSLFIDRGAFTFGVLPDSSPDGVPDTVRYLKSSDVLTDQPDTPIILYSADIGFLRKYAYRVFFYASVNNEFPHHIHLVGSRDECEAFMQSADARYRAVLDMRREGLPNNISWSYEPLPSEVRDPIAYYACARYMRALEFVDRFQRPVWIQDVDAFPTGDIWSSVSKFEGCDVALSISTRHSQFSPWRRYLAGNVYIAMSEPARRFFKSVSNYIWNFRERESAWMLDQNALAWAFERHFGDVRILDTRAVSIPITQSALNAKIETIR
jgi:hypothetical protein